MSVSVYNRFAALMALLALSMAVLLLFPGIRRWAARSGGSEVFPWIALTVAVLSTAGSLTYAIAYDFIPCELCWYQRIAMYPLVVILGVGAYLKESVRRFAFPLTITGMGLAIYHYLLQTFPEMTSTVCSVEVPCNSKYVNEFGFISIPFMALCGFIAITALLLAHKYEEAK